MRLTRCQAASSDSALWYEGGNEVSLWLEDLLHTSSSAAVAFFQPTLTQEVFFRIPFSLSKEIIGGEEVSHTVTKQTVLLFRNSLWQAQCGIQYAGDLNSFSFSTWRIHPGSEENRSTLNSGVSRTSPKSSPAASHLIKPFCRAIAHLPAPTETEPDSKTC